MWLIQVSNGIFVVDIHRTYVMLKAIRIKHVVIISVSGRSLRPLGYMWMIYFLIATNKDKKWDICIMLEINKVSKMTHG